MPKEQGTSRYAEPGALSAAIEKALASAEESEQAKQAAQAATVAQAQQAWQLLAGQERQCRRAVSALNKAWRREQSDAAFLDCKAAQLALLAKQKELRAASKAYRAAKAAVNSDSENPTPDACWPAIVSC